MGTPHLFVSWIKLKIVVRLSSQSSTRTLCSDDWQCASEPSALRSKLVGLLVVLKTKIMRIMIYCVYWGKADENPIAQESWKNLICERSVRMRSLTASVRLSG